MPLLLSWRASARGQWPDSRDTHGMALAQLLLREFDGRDAGHSGSRGSFGRPVHRQGTGRELAEPQATSCPLSGSSA